jgi:hypothetical protein
MANVVPLDDAWPRIFEAGGVTLTKSEVDELWHWIFIFTHGHARAKNGGKLTHDEVDLLRKAIRSAAALEAILEKFDASLYDRFDTACIAVWGQASGYSILKLLESDFPKLDLRGPIGFHGELKLFREPLNNSSNVADWCH